MHACMHIRDALRLVWMRVYGIYQLYFTRLSAADLPVKVADKDSDERTGVLESEREC